jgi:hypothetical protein
VSSDALADRYRTGRGVLLLWYPIFASVLAWKLQLMFNYALVPFACWEGLLWLIHLTSAVTLLLALSGVWVGYRIWERTTEESRHEDMESGWILGRTRFMAGAGVLLGGMMALVIVGQWIPTFIISPCFVGS